MPYFLLALVSAASLLTLAWFHWRLSRLRITAKDLKPLVDATERLEKAIKMPRTILLELDEDDWNTIQGEMARAQSHRDKDGPVLPDSDSNLAGVIIADAIRSLEEYRSMWESENP